MLRDPQPKPDSSDPPLGTRPEAVQLRARRSPKLIALGVLLVVLGGLGAATLFTLGNTNRAVVTMATDVTRGHTITREDLAVVEVPASLRLDALPAEQLSTLVGRRAASDLPKGAYPLPEHFGEDPLPDGQAIVGLLLSLGRLPTTDLAPGTTVRLVGIGAHANLSAEATVVTAPRQLEGGTAFSLNVRLPEADATRVAAAMGADELTLVVVREA